MNKIKLDVWAGIVGVVAASGVTGSVTLGCINKVVRASSFDTLASGTPSTPGNRETRCSRGHGLGHTHVSVLIRRGFNTEVVSDRLGHTSVAFTLQKYVHLFDDQRRQAAISMDDFLGVDPEKPID